MPVISDTQTTLSLLRDRAERSGDRVYASFDHQKLTVGDLYDQVRETAARLSNQGVSRGDRVAVMLDNHLDNLVLFFALIWVGAVHVPVNTRLRHASLEYVIERPPTRSIGIVQTHDRHCWPQQRYNTWVTASRRLDAGRRIFSS